MLCLLRSVLYHLCTCSYALYYLSSQLAYIQASEMEQKCRDAEAFQEQFQQGAWGAIQRGAGASAAFGWGATDSKQQKWTT